MNFKYFLILVLISFISACSDGSSGSMQELSNDTLEDSDSDGSSGSMQDFSNDTLEDSDDENTDLQLRECASSHAMVGQTGELSTLAHSVSGTVTIIDDCTIEITNFNYDGLGLTVEVYAGIDENYFPPVGFSLSEDLAGTTFENQTLTVQLPTNKTLDNLNGISIWCSDVGVSFGDSLIN